MFHCLLQSLDQPHQLPDPQFYYPPIYLRTTSCWNMKKDSQAGVRTRGLLHTRIGVLPLSYQALTKILHSVEPLYSTLPLFNVALKNWQLIYPISTEVPNRCRFVLTQAYNLLE